MSDDRSQARYALLYRLRLRPWELDGTPPELTYLAEHPTRGTGRGRALDLGCGTGRAAVDVARLGWQVVGVDFVPQAVEQARERAAAAGVDACFLVGDVTRLRQLDLGGPFDLVYDSKCFHGLPAASRQPYLEGVAEVCRPGGLYLLFALPPSLPRSLLAAPRGVDRREVEALFLPHFEQRGYKPGGRSLFSVACYWMRRRAWQDLSPNGPDRN